MIQDLNKKIFSNTAYQIIGKLVTSSLGFLVSVLIARHLGAIGFGQYNLIFAFLGLGGIIADFGLATLLIREVATKRADEKYFAGVFTLRLVLSFLVLGLAILVLHFFPYPLKIRNGIILVLLGNIFLSLSSVIWATFQAKLEFLKVVLIQIFSSISIILIVILGVLKSFPFLFFVLANGVGNLFGFLISLKFHENHKRYLIFDLKLFKKIFVEVWPIGFWAIVSTFYLKIDSIIISFYFDPSKRTDLGFYSAAYKYFEVAGVFFGFFQLTIFPIICAYLKKKNFFGMLKKLFFISVLLSILGTTLLSIFSSFLVSFFGNQFLPAASSLRILSLSLGLSILSGVWLAIAIAGGKQLQIFYFSVIALILNLILNLLFIPKLSFIGASWITVLTQLFITITDFLIAQKVLYNLKK